MRNSGNYTCIKNDLLTEKSLQKKQTYEDEIPKKSNYCSSHLVCLFLKIFTQRTILYSLHGLSWKGKLPTEVAWEMPMTRNVIKLTFIPHQTLPNSFRWLSIKIFMHFGASNDTLIAVRQACTTQSNSAPKTTCLNYNSLQ